MWAAVFGKIRVATHLSIPETNHTVKSKDSQRLNSFQQGIVPVLQQEVESSSPKLERLIQTLE